MDNKANLGILLVHGIGRQKQGDTLISFGEPLKHWLSAWLNQGDADPKSDKVQVLETSIVSEGTRRPSCSRFRLDVGGERREWLIAESWWADSFPPPRYIDLLRWVTVVLPLTLTSHFGRRVRLAFASKDRRSEKWFQILRTALQAVMFVTVLPIMGLGLVLVLALGVLPIPKLRGWLLAGRSTFLSTIGDSYLFVSSVLRGSSMVTRLLGDLAWLKRRCHRVVIVAHSQGAAVAHAALQKATCDGSEPQTDALITFGAGIRKLKELEAASTKRLIGAWSLSLLLIALSWALWLVAGWLLAGPPTGSDLARTLGWPTDDFIPGIDERNFFGIDLLAAWWVLPVLAALVIGVAQGLYVIATDRSMRSWSGIIGLATLSMLYVMGFVVFAAFLFATPFFYMIVVALGFASMPLLLDKTPAPDANVRLPKSIAWFDFYAAADPVPNGPLLDSDDPAVVESNEIENRDSALFDHTTYWSNREQFIAALAARAASVCSPAAQLLQGQEEFLLERARGRRRWRMSWLRVGRALALAAMAVPAFFWSDLLFPSGATPSTFSGLALKLIETLNSLPFVDIDTSEIPVRLLNRLGWITYVPVIVVLLGLMMVVWRWWDDVDNRTLCRREPYALLPLPFLSMALLLTSYLALSGLILPNSDLIRAAIASDPTVIAWLARQRGHPIGVEALGVVGATMYGILAAVGSAGLFTVLSLGWRGPARSTAPTIITFLASLPVAMPALLAGTGLRPLWLAAILFGVGAVLGCACFAVSLGHRLVAPSWAVHVSRLTGSGPLGLWLLARGSDDETLRAYADASCNSLVAERTRKARIQQELPELRMEPESFSFGEELEQVLLMRQAFANGTQLQETWRLYASVYPDAGIEFARAIKSAHPREALDILAKHEAHPAPRIRYAVKRARAAIDKARLHDPMSGKGVSAETP